MRDLKEIGLRSRPSEDPRQPPSDREVREFEEAFSVQLPKEYVDMLRYCNGGHPKLEFCPLDGGTEGFGICANIFYFLSSKERDDSDSLWYQNVSWRQSLGRKVITIADDGCGNQVVLDFNHDPPSVAAYFHEDADGLVHAGRTFDEFLRKLILPPS